MLMLILITPLVISYGAAEGLQQFYVTLYVYEDGTVLVYHHIHVIDPPENISISLLGEPILVEAKTDTTLIPVYIVNETANFIAPDSEVELKYMTSSLTNKTGEEWILSYTASYKTYVILPNNTIPYSISPANFSVDLINNTIALVMPSGKVTIKYILTPQVPSTEKVSHPSSTINIKYYLYIVTILVALSIIFYIIIKKRGWNKGSVYKDLDERDNKILNILSKYGELTAREIMEKTSIPKTPLYRRLRRLVDTGLIETRTSGGVVRYRIKLKK